MKRINLVLVTDPEYLNHGQDTKDFLYCLEKCKKPKYGYTYQIDKADDGRFDERISAVFNVVGYTRFGLMLHKRGFQHLCINQVSIWYRLH